MGTKEIAIKFAIYLASNWIYEDETWAGVVYSSKSNCLNIQSIDEIYYEWTKDFNNQIQ
jgi:hypothetical protein